MHSTTTNTVDCMIERYKSGTLTISEFGSIVGDNCPAVEQFTLGIFTTENCISVCELVLCKNMSRNYLKYKIAESCSDLLIHTVLSSDIFLLIHTLDVASDKRFKHILDTTSAMHSILTYFCSIVSATSITPDKVQLIRRVVMRLHSMYDIDPKDINTREYDFYVSGMKILFNEEV